MVFVIPFLSIYHARKNNTKVEGKKGSLLKLFPLFIFGFIAFAIIRSIGDIGASNGGEAFGIISADTWSGMYGSIKNAAVQLLVVALAGVGFMTNIKKFKGLGIKPFITGFSLAVIVGLVSFTAISLIWK